MPDTNQGLSKMLLFIGFIIVGWIILGLASGLSSQVPSALKPVVWIVCVVIEYNLLSYGYSYSFPSEEAEEELSVGEGLNQNRNINNWGEDNSSNPQASSSQSDDKVNNGSFGYTNNTGVISDPSVINESGPSTPEPQLCRACRGTGECFCIRDGHPGKERGPLSMTTDEPVYQTHQYCHGTGKCPACGGDGQLDYGIDY